MANQTISRIRDWGEPAHPAIVKLHEDLLKIYGLIRKFQPEIDQAFDKASRQIGYVVTTTLPVQMRMGEKGQFEEFSMAGEHLKDTIFERELSPVLKKIAEGDPDGNPSVSPGTFHLYLIWFEALRLKLRTDWMEPVHLRQAAQTLKTHWKEPVHSGTHWMEPVHPGTHWMEPVHVLKDINPKLDTSMANTLWEAREPAHWFDRGAILGVSEVVVIEAIDAVYPELNLVERISRYRRGADVALNPQPLPPRA